VVLFLYTHSLLVPLHCPRSAIPLSVRGHCATSRKHDPFRNRRIDRILGAMTCDNYTRYLNLATPKHPLREKKHCPVNSQAKSAEASVYEQTKKCLPFIGFKWRDEGPYVTLATIGKPPVRGSSDHSFYPSQLKELVPVPRGLSSSLDTGRSQKNVSLLLRAGLFRAYHIKKKRKRGVI